MVIVIVACTVTCVYCLKLATYILCVVATKFFDHCVSGKVVAVMYNYRRIRMIMVSTSVNQS